MEKLMQNIRIEVNPKIYLKNPQSSELGKKIISQGLHLIDDMGLEQFTFGKLAKKLKTTESSIYRYFENKHKILQYVTNWFWAYQEYRVVFATNNMTDVNRKLQRAFDVLCNPFENEKEVQGLPVQCLFRVLINESPKAYLVKSVDESNKEGVYKSFKSLVSRLSELAKEINPSYPYPHSLMSTLMESIHHQMYFAEHLPRLSDFEYSEKISSQLSVFCCEIAISSLENYKNNEVQ